MKCQWQVKLTKFPGILINYIKYKMAIERRNHSNKGGDFCLELEDVGKVLTKYFATGFTEGKDVETGEISTEFTNVRCQFEIK